ncbi:MAG TPA: hypothetical protein VFE53_17770 [Mucilaginibacter sp.]|jgi:AraC-like DNA-binding protein|nr:hypothetical protein [Mucilaginibacter sp.]
MIEIFQDIKKTYVFSQASLALTDFIEFYGETCPEKTSKYLQGNAYTIRMFPSWTPTFYINLGTAYQMSVGNQLHTIGSADDVLIARNNIVERFNQPDDHIFIVKFHPGCLEALLGYSQASLNQGTVDLRLLLPTVCLKNLKRAGTFAERCLLMDRYLEQLSGSAGNKKICSDVVRQATDDYLADRTMLSNGRLSEKYFTTSKTLYRYFIKATGASPKQYFSGLRARLALAEYVKVPRQFDPYPFGYFDRSHFYKDVRNFTGQKLSGLN